jgi:hypothetical protein
MLSIDISDKTELKEGYTKNAEKAIEASESEEEVQYDEEGKVIAKAKGIPVEGYSWKDDYTGVLYVEPETMDVDKYNEILSKLINTGEYDKENYKFSPGEYLIVPPYCTDDKSKSTIFKYNSEGFFE